MEATTADAAPSGGSPFAHRLDRYFDITARGSSIPTEIRGGAATFLTMAYILFVNPQILGSVAAPGGVKLPFDQLLTVTALVAAVATLAMGIYGRYPFALAAGLGINAFVAFSLVGADRLSWPDAMGVDRRRGPGHHGAGPRRLPRGGHQRHPPRPQARHRDRHRPLHHDHRAGRRRHRHQGPGHRRDDRARSSTRGRSRSSSSACSGPTRWSRGASAARCSSGSSAPRSSRRSSTRPRTRRSSPTARPRGPTRSSTRRTSASSGDFSFHFFSALGFWSAVAVVLSVLLSDFFDTAGTVLGLGRRAELVTPDGRLPGHAPRAARRLAGRGRRRRGVGVLEHDVHRELGGHRRGRAHRPGLGRDRAALRLLPVHLAAGRDHPQRGDGARCS